jgi:hypothetical protein
LDPFKIHHVKIPDTQTWPSFTSTLLYRGSAAAVAGIGTSAGIYAAGAQFNGILGSGTNPISEYVVGGTNGWRAGTNIDITGRAGVMNASVKYRIVSAGIACNLNSALTTAKGAMAMYSIDGAGAFSATDTAPSTLLTYPNSRKCPLIPGHTCAVNYWPNSQAGFEYQASASASTSVCMIGFLMSGLSSGDTIEYVVAINVEAIPNNTALGVYQIAPSKCDFKALQFAMNCAQADRIYFTEPTDVQTANYVDVPPESWVDSASRVGKILQDAYNYASPYLPGGPITGAVLSGINNQLGYDRPF